MTLWRRFVAWWRRVVLRRRPPVVVEEAELPYGDPWVEQRGHSLWAAIASDLRGGGR